MQGLFMVERLDDCKNELPACAHDMWHAMCLPLPSDADAPLAACPRIFPVHSVAASATPDARLRLSALACSC